MKAIQVSEGDATVVHRFLETILRADSLGGLHRLSLNDGPLCSQDVHLLTGLQQLQDLELGISLANPAWQQHLTALTDLTALKSLEIEVRGTCTVFVAHLPTRSLTCWTATRTPSSSFRNS